MMRFMGNHHSDSSNIHDPQHEDIRDDAREIESPDDDTSLTTESRVANKLSTAQQYAQMGQLQYAYALSKEATIAAPDNVDAWLLRGAFAVSTEEGLACISRAVALAPDHSGAKSSMYNTLKRYLEQDPFLRYIEETELLYRVLTGEGRAITVSKDRGVSPSYPLVESTPVKPVLRLVILSAIGLLPAGIGAVVFAPIAAAKAWRTSQKPLNGHQRRQVRMALLYADVLFVLGLLLGFVFLLHL